MKILAAAIGLVLVLQQQPIRVEVELQQLVVTVRDQMGRLARGLRAEDFIIEEDGVPHEIAHFALDAEAPVSLGILIDNRRKGGIDNSMDRILVDREGEHGLFVSAIAATRELVGFMKPGDEYALMTFLDSVKVEQEFTTNVGDIEARLERIKPTARLECMPCPGFPNTNTTTLNAIERALERMKKAKSGKRALLVFSSNDDGRVGDSKELARLKDLIPSAETMIYGFGMERSDTRSMAEAMIAVASASGGLSRVIDRPRTPPEREAAASELIRTLVSDLRGQYRIGYYPRNPDPKAKRAIRVRTSAPQYRVYSRRDVTALAPVDREKR